MTNSFFSNVISHQILDEILSSGSSVNYYIVANTTIKVPLIIVWEISPTLFWIETLVQLSFYKYMKHINR